jgi:hypothetical protein
MTMSEFHWVVHAPRRPSRPGNMTEDKTTKIFSLSVADRLRLRIRAVRPRRQCFRQNRHQGFGANLSP